MKNESLTQSLFFLKAKRNSLVILAISCFFLNKSYGFQLIDDVVEAAKLVAKPVGYTAFGSMYFENQILPESITQLGRKDLDPSLVQPMASQVVNENIKRNWVRVPTSSDKNYLINEFYFKDILSDGVPNFLKSHENPYAPKKLTQGDLNEMQEKGKIHIAIFSMEHYQLNYFAGRTLIKNAKGYLKKDVDPNRMPEKFNLIAQTKVANSNLSKTVGIFNGTYFNDDTAYSYTTENARVDGLAEGARPAGLYTGGHLFDGFNPFLATTYLTTNGDLAITQGLKDFDNANRLQDLQWARQNEPPILLNGKAVGVYPKYWNRYADNVLRSYLAVNKEKKYFAYVWTTYATPAEAGSALLKLGFTDATLVDIHPVIACMLYRPSKSAIQAGSFNNKNIFDNNQRFFFVPNKIINGYQWNPDEAQKGSFHDFFSISEK